jgi:hypothetical protein
MNPRNCGFVSFAFGVKTLLFVVLCMPHIKNDIFEERRLKIIAREKDSRFGWKIRHLLVLALEFSSINY